MIENYLLQYLVTFAESGSLSAASKKLHISAASVSRGLKKLENQLDTPLFTHNPQRLTLTSAGKYAVLEAKKILTAEKQFPQLVKNYYQKENTLTVATSLPAPIILLNSSNINLEKKLISPNNIQQNLLSHEYSVIFSNQEIQTTNIESKFIIKESLSVMLTPYNSLYGNNTVTFQDLSSNEFIVLSNLGPWKTIIEQNILHAKFIYQNSLESFNELIQYSNFPLFATNLSLNSPCFFKNTKRKIIPITNPEASLNIYATYLKSDKTQVAPIIHQISENAKKADELYSSTLKMQ
ncbi:LysR family transcriptional regulator [Lactobacillus sp. LL6]|uniref:LysR family transcriptional regulator n=1 Tax=Lactobacillus sp. LL6 TaxID=2596827 RepID=UPI001186138A|nr:LysR family transcriptional regulator [Lactobacillus sp. LL6]TSO26398.1 LysR family transcriptional regulator [Lactobacillus sp. LL6]